ncbi:ATP-binding protein [Methylobacterium sp. E-045]|uniref:ATP-binding protein n=1 Tax=Methylobacterium sp. E-045 TaxID=2836575 RepID=UPI001FBBD7A1|nr:ATP-binding protein [Methylobacterium sp. E-045]MCJ2127323.1 ATP-binding protein [Methylobacterium sp. E-045]
MITLEVALALILFAILAAASLLPRGLRRPTGDPSEVERLQDSIWRMSESEERYRALVEATTDVIVQRDAQGRITFANEGFGRLFGVEALTLLGSTVDLEILDQGLRQQQSDGVSRVEMQVRPVDGIPRWFSFIETRVTGPGGRTQWLRAGSDITERIESARSLDEALHRAEAANVAKSRFLATVSHEFRTPLNGILGMADLVLETGLDAEQRTYVEAVHTSGRALLTLIDGILDFSRIEAGRLDLSADPFDLRAVVEGVVELLAPRAQDKGIEIAIDVADDVPPEFIGDADRIRQIVVNLAGNAIKFTNQGGVGVTIRWIAQEIVLAVSDTGAGIPAARIPILFEEFEQGDNSASTRHEGTGLGLAISRRLASRMGGRIDAQSVVGRGSTFTVSLPLPVGAESETTGPPISLHGRRILIVADSPYQAPFLARRLSRSGASAVVVPNVGAGLDTLSGVPFDAVIADRALGDESVRRLAADARRRGVRCSLILLSPFDRREFGAPGAAGFDSYLIKPVRARSLFDRLLAPTSSVETPGPAAKPAPGNGEDPPAKDSPRVLPSVHVLLAEDNPINALLATRALERLGATVVLARDGSEALARLDHPASRFDLALIDIRMPGIDGLETARRLRASEAEHDRAPLRLVALTANTGREDELAAREAGFDEFLAKPLDLKALPALLERRSVAAA